MTEGPTDHPTDRSSGAGGTTPPPLTVAASLAGVQGLVLLMLAVLELASVTDSRPGVAVSTAVFFGAYGAVLTAAALALWRRHGWARGPVLITQLIVLGLAWNLREQILIAVGLAALGLVVIAAVIHPATIAALDGSTEHPDDSGDPDGPDGSGRPGGGS
ncbi:hypothetical protein [Nocardioides sp. L-11A]|uniref:hypothetical protein n=1 Tax=Nocardioides sp. L-11A TaxID=3043848 RepID=UPI00249B76F5|nr:hypothetical protein QJ852_17345 [Nocardioides sp. L-11A]